MHYAGKKQDGANIAKSLKAAFRPSLKIVNIFRFHRTRNQLGLGT